MDKLSYHKELCDKIHKLYEAKNSDYGDSVSNTYNKYGLVSFLVRLEDKLNRLYTLNKNGSDIKITDEKLEDTLLDLANYALIAIVEIKNSEIDLCATETKYYNIGSPVRPIKTTLERNEFNETY